MEADKHMDAAFADDFEAQLKAMEQIENLEKEKAEFLKARQANLPKFVIEKREKHVKAKLKSDLKKSNAYVKKLKQTINSEGIQQCIRDA